MLESMSMRTRRSAHLAFLASTLLFALSAIGIPWILIEVGPRPLSDLRYWLAVAATPVLWALAVHLVGHALVTFGVLPLLMVWRSDSRLVVGSLLGRLGSRRHRLVLDPDGFEVKMLDDQRRQPAVGHMFYPEITSGQARLELRTYGIVTREEIYEFLMRARVQLTQ